MDDYTIVATGEHVACELDGEAVVLQTGTGVYFSMNALGARIWELIQEPTRVATLREQLAAEYDVSLEQVTADVNTFVTELADHALIEVVGE